MLLRAKPLTASGRESGMRKKDKGDLDFEIAFVAVWQTSDWSNVLKVAATDRQTTFAELYSLAFEAKPMYRLSL